MAMTNGSRCAKCAASERATRFALGGLLAWAFTSTAVAATADETALALAAETVTTVARPTADYRATGARHLYDTFAHRVFRGRLPPLLYAIAIVDTEIDAEGRVLNAVVTREPAAAKEVMPWILGLIRQASPFPKPASGARAVYHDIWLIDRSYTFQLDTLTEGQD